MSNIQVKSAEFASGNEVIAHWPHLVEKFQFSPLDFYALVEKALCDRQIPQIEFSRVELPEGGMLSPKRTYLRIRRERLIFDVCAAPFGTGFFVSTWFWERSLKIQWVVLLSVPILLVLLYLIGFLYTIIVFAVGIAGGILYLLRGGLTDLDAVLIQLPVIGYLYERFFRKQTYYRIDLVSMFQAAVQHATTETVDQITSVQGIAPMSELTRKPIMKQLRWR